MKIAGVAMCAAAVLLVGCGGGNQEPEEQIGTTKINPGGTGVATNATSTATNVLADITTMKYRRVTNATAVVTNVVRIYYHNKNRFTGRAVKRDPDGTASYMEMKDGLWHGTFRIMYPGGKQAKLVVKYENGLRTGPAFERYANGRPWRKYYYTNGFRVGPMVSFHPNGNTNKVVVYSSKIPGKILRRAAFDLNGKPLTGQYVGRKTPWEIGGSDASKQIRTLYNGKPTSTIITVFGPPRKEGNQWTYLGLKITHKQTGAVSRGVRFTIANDVVTAVEVLP